MKISTVFLIMMLSICSLQAKDPKLMWVNYGNDFKPSLTTYSHDGTKVYINVKNRIGNNYYNSINVLNIKTGFILDSIPVLSDIKIMDASIDGNYLIFAYENDLAVNVIDLNKRQIIRTDTPDCVNKYNVDIISLAIQPDSKSYIAWESSIKKIQKFELQTGKKTFIECFGDTVKSFNLNSCCKFFSIVRNDSSISIWSIDSLKEMKRIRLSSYPVYHSISPDGKYLLTGYDYYTEHDNVKLYNVSTGAKVNESMCIFFEAYPIFTSDSRQFIVASSMPEGYEIRNINTFNQSYFKNGLYKYSEILVSPTDTVFGFNNLETKQLEFHSINTSKIISVYPSKSMTMLTHAQCVKIHPQLKAVYAGGNDGLMNVYDFSTGKLLNSFYAHSNFISKFDISSDGKFLVTCSYNDTVKLWNIEGENYYLPVLINTGVLKFHDYLNYFTDITFSPDNKYIAAGVFNMGLCIFKTKDLTFKLIDSSYIKTYGISTLAFSPDGKKISIGAPTIYLVTFNVDLINNIFMLDTAFRADFSPPVNGWEIRSINYSSDGKLICNSSNYLDTYVWNADNYEQVASFRPLPDITTSNIITSSIFVNNNKNILISNGNVINLYSLDSNAFAWNDETTFYSDNSSNVITYMHPSKNQNYFAASNSSGTIALYDLTHFTDIQDNNLIQNIENLYPNPATNFIELNFNDPVTAFINHNRIEIYSTIGVKKLETEFTQRIDVSSLQPGIYFAKIGNKVMKFVKN